MQQIVVLKFGGTSVATAEGRRAIGMRIREHLTQGRAPVLVVSAMGRRPEPYATDTLLDLVAGLPGNARERAWLASIGEDLSAIRIAHELRASGLAAIALSGPAAGLISDGEYENAAVSLVNTTALDSCIAAGQIPVVCGFQAATPTGEVATLGRGGSDTSACVLGAALGADCVEIYTDVDGVMSADPRTVADARVIRTIRADELHQMAKSGSKVVHTPAAEIALRSAVPLVVRNTFSDHPGTRVVDIGALTPETVATAIASTAHVVRYTVELGAECGEVAHMGAQTLVYEAMAREGVSLDMFTPADGRLLFTVSAADAELTGRVLGDLGLAHRVNTGLAKVTVVGAGMHGVPGVMARLARALCDAQVDVYQVADSHMTISVLVEENLTDVAVRALHAAFGLGSAA